VETGTVTMRKKKNAHDADQQTGWAWVLVKKRDWWWYCSLHRADEKMDPGWLVVVDETITERVVRRMLKNGLKRWVVWVADDGCCYVNVVDGQQREVTP
jgi:hypothetical protein